MHACPPITRQSCVHPWHRPLQWTSWQHIWPTNPPRTRKQGTAQRASALATTPPLPSLRARPLFPLTVASSTQASPTQVDPHCHAPNFAYADLLELRELVHDLPLHRDTSERRNNPIFGQLSTFAKDGTSPFSVAFRHWERRYDEWKEASARTWGICRTPTKTDFLTSQTLDDSADDPTNLHPFYSCPTATADAQNIWTLPAAPEWWHDALWQLGDETWTHLRPESDHRDAWQGDLRWRFFRAARELKSISGCTLTLVPPSLQKPSPDFVHTELLLASYIKILGAKTLSMATLVCCHCTQELLRMKWEWVPLSLFCGMPLPVSRRVLPSGGANVLAL